MYAREGQCFIRPLVDGNLEPSSADLSYHEPLLGAARIVRTWRWGSTSISLPNISLHPSHNTFSLLLPCLPLNNSSCIMHSSHAGLLFHIVINSNDLRGTWEPNEYTAADGNFTKGQKKKKKAQFLFVILFQ